MPVKKATVKKTAAKKAKPKSRAKKGDAYSCGVCGYRIVVDDACGCAEEHVFICCDKPMKQAAAKA